MARDRPSPYGEGTAFFPVAWGPVPRDLPTSAKNTRNPETTDGCCHDRCMARDRPSPYGEGTAFFPVAWGPVPRDLPTSAKNTRNPDRCMARDRPSPYGIEGGLEAWRGTGPRPTVNGDGFLLPNHHLPRRRKITRRQRIEIHPASNRLTLRIPAIPIRRATPTLITPCTPMPEI